MIYRAFPPHPQLARHVACLWYLRKSADPSAAADHLRITLTGDQKGQPAQEIYDLKRAK